MPKINLDHATRRAAAKDMLQRPDRFLKSFYTNELLKQFNDDQKAEYLRLIAYLKALSKREFTNRPSFRKEELTYKAFPSVVGTVKEMVNILTTYLASADSENDSNQVAKSFVNSILQKDKRSFNAFYFGYLDFIKQDEIKALERTFIEQFNDAIKKIMPHCSDKEIATSFGYLLDILDWAKTHGINQESNKISYTMVKKNVLEIIENNLLEGCPDEHRLSPYLCQNFLYEIAIREKNIQKMNQYFLDIIYNYNEADRKYLYQNITNRYAIANEPYEMKLTIFFNFVKHGLLEKDATLLFKSFRTLFEILINPINENGSKEKVSFRKYCEISEFLLSQIGKNLDCYEISNDIKTLICFRVILDGYINLLSEIEKILEQIYNIFDYKNKMNIPLSDFQKNQLEKILSSEKFQKDSPYYRIPYNIKTNLSYLYDEDFTLSDIEARMKKIKDINGIVMVKLLDFSFKINALYFDKVKPYIKSLVPEDIVDELYRDNEGEKSITFCIRKDKVIDLFKEYQHLLKSTSEGIVFDLNHITIVENSLENFVNEVVKAYRSVHTEQKKIREVKQFYESQEAINLEKSISLLTLYPKKIEPEVTVSISKDMGDQFANTIDEPLFKTQKNKRPKTFSLGIRDSESSDKKRVNKNDKKMTDDIVLAEIREVLKTSNRGEEINQYTIRPLRFHKEMKHPIWIAINTNLTEAGREISQRDQVKINELAKNISFAAKENQNGIKYVEGGVFYLKARYTEKSYRGTGHKILLKSGGFLVVFDEVIKKAKGSDHKLRSTIKANKR